MQILFYFRIYNNICKIALLLIIIYFEDLMEQQYDFAVSDLA